jgi:hypothetical protein
MTKHDSNGERRPTDHSRSCFVLRHSFVIRHSSFVIATLLLLSSSSTKVIAQKSPDVVIVDRWETAHLNDTRSGYVHTRVVEHKDGDQVHYVSTIEMRLQVKRPGIAAITLAMEVGNTENAQGFVTGTTLKQFDNGALRVLIEGKVAGNKLQLVLNKVKLLAEAPWNDRVVGIYGQMKLLKDSGLKPGAEVPFQSFEPTINLIVNAHVKAGEPEEVRLPGEKRKLLRAEIHADKIKDFQPPPLTVWLDGDRDVVASVTELPGMGRLNLYRSNKAIATAVTGAANLVELESYVPIARRVPQPHQTTEARFRIRIQGDEHAATGFPQDERQKVVGGSGDTVELEVKKGPFGHAEKVGPEYLESSYFITSDDEEVQKLAREAVGTETDPWKKALRIERYVHSKLRATSDQNLATAQQVARSLKGDCTEYSMLAAAMCRAEKVPARTAVGLVYGEFKGRPVFGFHMWPEVWIAGEWRGIEPTLGQGIGAMHIKISDQSWTNEVTAAPLLPTLRVLGKVSIEVMQVETKTRP